MNLDFGEAVGEEEVFKFAHKICSEWKKVKAKQNRGQKKVGLVESEWRMGGLFEQI